MAKKKQNGSRVYKRIDLVGVSSTGFEDAIQNAVSKANESLQGLSWFEVKELRGAISNGNVNEYQAILTISFEVL
jgi:flavin-binding protein dodecin